MHNRDDLLFAFGEHLKVLNRSPATITAYTDHIRQCFDDLQPPDIKTVTTAMIKAWIADLYDYRTPTGRPYSTGTICLKVRAVKRFFEFLAEANIIFIDIPILTPKRENRRTRCPELPE